MVAITLLGGFATEASSDAKGTSRLAFHLFDRQSIPAEMMPSTGSVKDSRNLCPKLIEMRALGQVKPYPGNHEFHVHFIGAKKLIGQSVSVNEGAPISVPTSFGPGNPIKVLIGEKAIGKGYLRVPKGWADESSAMIVRTPWVRPNDPREYDPARHIWYPPSGSLKTASSETSDIAGASGYPGELAWLLRHEQSNYCFVK